MDDNIKLITDCFYFVINKIRQIFIDNGIHFDESIFQPTKKISIWTPFKDALFYPWRKQSDRRIVLSTNEIYLCNRNQWAFSTVLTSESGRQLVGYVMKQMEAVLRTATKYKYKLSANIDTVTHAAVGKLKDKGLSLEKIISDAVVLFYREATKTVVKVDHKALSKIRKEALATQEKLIVPEQEEPPLVPVTTPHNLYLSAFQDIPRKPSPDKKADSMTDNRIVSMSDNNSESLSDVWGNFKNVLTSTEIEALSVVLQGQKEIKKFADECGIMLEVLIDGINEKAMDSIGDNLMDEEFVLYDDYIEQVKELVGGVW